MTKICYRCDQENHIYAGTCIKCGFKFPEPNWTTRYLDWQENEAIKKRGRPPPQPCKRCES